jgi:hypothetical protein
MRKFFTRAILIGFMLIPALSTGSAQTEQNPSQPESAQYVTAPTDLTDITVTSSAGVGEGYIFAANFLPAAYMNQPNPGSYLLIIDNQGEPVYYQKVPQTTFGADFKKLSNGLLTYWQGGHYYLLDQNYTQVGVISTVGDYAADPIDMHDLILTPEGNYMFTIYHADVMDLSGVVEGGHPQANVIDIIIQEVDPEGNLVFQWKGLDAGHFDITDSNQNLAPGSPEGPAPWIDYVHSNAVALDTDGNLLLSSRHLDEITKIDRTTGEIIWRLGGKKNQFVMQQGPGITELPEFFYQHDIRVLGENKISLYDNHNAHVPMVSRALEYDLDVTSDTKTATLTWAYVDPGSRLYGFMGNSQKLPNGNHVIGWGGPHSSPNITEVTSDGTEVFSLGFDAPYTSYRGYRFPWVGTPTWAPVLAANGGTSSLDLYMSWNGATEIAFYNVYGWNLGNDPTLLATVDKSGFEEKVTLNGDQAGYCNYQVMPINNQDNTTTLSNVVVNPGCNPIYLPLLQQ